MNEEEVKDLYEKMSVEYNVPMPTYFFYPRVITQPTPWFQITKYMSFHFLLKSEEFDDPFGFICLSKGERGSRKDEVVHEFIHYVDHVRGLNSDEMFTRHRTRKFLHKTRTPRVPVIEKA